MRIESWVGVLSLCLLSFTVLTIADERQLLCRRSAFPPNVELRADLERVLQRIYDASPTFRLQCQRIGRATNLYVRVEVNASFQRRCRAFTIVQRHGHRLRADVHLPPGAALTEMVAHEFEHVLEQIDGVDLRRMARIPRSGVYEVDRELFESDRAQAAGRIVVAELIRYRKLRGD